MITLNLEKDLEDILRKFARENNIQVETLIETVLYDYADTIDVSLDEDDLSEFSEADVEMMKKSLGF